MLPGEDIPKPFVLDQGVTLSARERVQAHQARMRLLQRRLFRHGRLQCFASAREVPLFLKYLGEFDEQVQIQSP